ncbi:Stk1 family PASTA domain-containing Ser/Thr kinase [Thermoflavimicrobium dichotomicum]|nr:Stk1 family PASTA domain-containing Ser/Thr kinase [Thermoflavimicrobium dichotomicum]
MEGRKLGGRYEVISRIGGGGMAIVYKARDLKLNRYVAIKILSESLSNDSEFIRRFSREAQAAASLSHPNVVNVYDVGRDGYIHYIVMELVEGPTLKQYILDQGPLPVDEAARIAIQICDGLAHAHENQIIHRDIKPHNILLNRHGQAKVTDFGIARAASSSTITQQGSVMGSVHYFSPEQARGGQIGEKSDIYSLGIVLYEMLTGELPFDGDSAVSIAIKHLQEDPVDPRKLNPNIPDHMATIILRAMQKDPNMRYTSVRAMKQDLEYALQLGTSRPATGFGPRIENVFETIPLTGDDSTPSFTQRDDSPVQRPEIRTNNNDTRRKHSQNTVGEHTQRKLENQLKGISADQNKTIFQKTMVYIQEKLTWWQKLLFGLFTFAVIIFLAFYGFTKIWGWMGDKNNSSSDGSSQNLSGDMVTIPDVKGMEKDEAKAELEKLGLKVKSRMKKSDEVKPDSVLKTDPAIGEKVKKGSTVTIFVNIDGVKVGDYRGHFEQSATRPIPKKGNGYDIRIIYCASNGKAKTGQAYAQDPAPGEYIQKGGTVEVWVEPGNGICKKKPPSNSAYNLNRIPQLVASADPWLRGSADFISSSV